VKILAVVLAAGEGRRLGGPKALARIRDRTFLARACHLVDRPGVASVVAVIGADADRVRRDAGVADGVTIIENDRWKDGMLSSVWRGLDAAEGLGADAVLLHPVDHPLVSPDTVDRVVAALARGAFAAVPSHDTRRGHPGGFGREAMRALRGAPPDQGARAILAAHAGRVVHVEGDPGCLVGINTPEDYRLFVR
jgi:CTP:molybdopterin cytidylyltransferase MocA